MCFFFFNNNNNNNSINEPEAQSVVLFMSVSHSVRSTAGRDWDCPQGRAPQPKIRGQYGYQEGSPLSFFG